MVMNTVAAATPDVGGGTVVSFGSGDSGGRLARAATGRGSQRNASPARVRAVVNEIRRGTGLSQRRRNLLIKEIDDNRNARGNIRTGILADILADFRDLNG